MFSKRHKGLISTGDKFKTDLSIIKTVVRSNENRKKIHINRIKKILGSIKRKKIAFLGVTFKPNTDDMRDSVSLKMIPYLCKNGADVSYYDPTGSKKNFKNIKGCRFKKNVKETCKNANLIILHTEWDEFKTLEFNKIVKNKDYKILDLRNLYNLQDMKNKKIKYFSVGRPNIN